MHDIDPRIDAFIDAYIDSSIDDDQFEVLCDWLREDAEHRQSFARKLALHSEIAEWCIERSGGQLAGSLPDDAQKTEDASAVFALLQEAEEAAKPLAVTIHDGKDWDGPGLSNKQWRGAVLYLYEHYVTPRVITTIAAAAVLLGMVLSAVLLNGPEETKPIVDVPDLPDTVTPDQPRVFATVATITDAVGAQWRWGDADVDLPIGSRLYQHDRLTLAKGFAQVTTKSGAQVLLQAPCTIELTTSDNAVRLHSGKLVGRCDTPSSKGFVVHAPGLDVVDLGTAFGVEADAEDGSTVLVMEGSVRAQPAETSPRAFRPVVLEKGQSRRVLPETGSLATIAASEVPVFYEQVPHPYVQAVLQAQPMAYWRFEDGSDQTVVNEIKPGRSDLDVRGGATHSNAGLIGRGGQVINPEGRDDYFVTPEIITPLLGAEAFTLECWFYVPDRMKRVSSVIGMYSITDDREIRIINQLELIGSVAHSGGGVAHSHRLHQSNAGGASGTETLSKNPHEINHWHHFVLAMQSGVYTLYLDGIAIDTLQVIDSTGDRPRIVLGHSPAYTEGIDRFFYRPFSGLIDEAALYDRALTADEVASHWKLGQRTEADNHSKP